MERFTIKILLLIIVALIVVPAVQLQASVPSDGEVSVSIFADETKESSLPWWAWPIILFMFCLPLGIVSVLGGVGGAVLFVPIISGFFPFHIDFVRGTGLLVALSDSLSAGPTLLRRGIADIKLALPVALITSISAIIGAIIGLRLPADIIQLALGISILGILVIMIKAGRRDFPDVKKPDPLAAALNISGIYYEESTGKHIDWTVHNTLPGLLVFVLVGFTAGMFGLGAGWANVPVLNLVMGAPFKVSVASSHFLLSITDTAAAWIYINKGAILAIMAIPCVAGVMIGSRIGARILAKTHPSSVRYIVLGLLLIAGLRAITKALWG